MHSYSTDSSERERILFGLALLSVGAALGLSRILHASHITLPWWFDAPSTMTFYGVFFTVFDRALWRIPLLRQIGLLEVPVLAGNWTGHLLSSFDNHSKPHSVQVRIEQTWTRIMIALQSELSASFTLVAAIQVNAADGIVLSYQYENQPRPNALKTMEIHLGTARLVFARGRCLEGYYYSGRGRQNYGTLYIERIEKSKG